MVHDDSVRLAAQPQLDAVLVGARVVEPQVILSAPLIRREQVFLEEQETLSCALQVP